MKVGHGVAPIAVRPGEALGGYGARDNGVEGVLDPLEAHALAFSDDRRRFLLVVLDVVSVNADLVESIRGALRSDADIVWVSATHTHSAPDSGCRPGGGPTPASVAERLLVAACAAAREAMATETEAEVQVRRVWCPGAAAARNVEIDAAAPLPIDVLVVTAAGTGERLGTLVVAPIHPTLLPAGNTRASADLSGAIRRAVARAVDGGWVVAATGAAGDISTRATRRGRDLAEADRIGDLVAAAVRDADGVAAPTAVAGSDAAGIAAAAAEAVLEPNARWAVGRAVTAGSDATAARRQAVLEEGLRLVEELGGHGTAPVRIRIESVRLGPASLVGVPGEPFLAVAERIRSGSVHRPIVLGYTNGYVGYLPEAGSPASYETVVSPVDPESVDELVGAARSSVARTWRRE